MTTLVSNVRNYVENVTNYLEYLEYPDMIQEFSPDCIADSMSKTMIVCYQNQVSSRLCAIIIWSMTMNYQIIPLTKSAIKH